MSKRHKAGVPFQIKPMDIPMQIVKRHEAFWTDRRLSNIGSHDMVDRRIKKIAIRCGIEKTVSST